jgi:hypothetical protein
MSCQETSRATRVAKPFRPVRSAQLTLTATGNATPQTSQVTASSKRGSSTVHASIYGRKRSGEGVEPSSAIRRAPPVLKFRHIPPAPRVSRAFTVGQLLSDHVRSADFGTRFGTRSPGPASSEWRVDRHGPVAAGSRVVASSAAGTGRRSLAVGPQSLSAIFCECRPRALTIVTRVASPARPIRAVLAPRGRADYAVMHE